MPFKFVVRQNEEDGLVFFGGKCVEGYLKPSEIGVGIVSQPFDFVVECDDMAHMERFSKHLKRMVDNDEDLNKGLIGSETKMIEGRDQIRMSICSVGPLTLETEEETGSKDNEDKVNDNAEIGDEDFTEIEDDLEIDCVDVQKADDDSWICPEIPPVATMPMKLKLFSNIPLHYSRLVMEQGCLTRLARVCGPQNVTLEIQGIGNADCDDFPCHQRILFCWNEEDLVWETQAPVAFAKADLQEFGNDTARFNTFMLKVSFHLSDSGMARVLQRIYGGDNPEFQKELLDQQKFTDLMILSSSHKNQKEDGKLIRCHRTHLAGASPAFASMLDSPHRWTESNVFEESRSRLISLSESKVAIRAMLQFIYCGGTDAIFADLNVAVELLQAAHKYELKNLEEVTKFIIFAKIKDRDWFTVDAALELFKLSRNMNEHTHGDKIFLREMMKLCVEFLETSGHDQLKACKEYQELYRIAEKLGPGFVAALGFQVENETDNFLPNYPLVDISRRDAALMYDFLCCSSVGGGGRTPKTLGIALGLILLAEHCYNILPDIIFGLPTYLWQSFECYDVDYLVDLFCLSRLGASSYCWKQLKIKAVQLLKEYVVQQPEKTEASQKFVAMFQTDYKAALEFNRLSLVECSKEYLSDLPKYSL